MKKRMKLLWGLFILLMLIGGIIMSQKDFLSKKTTQITREQQIAYLKKHEQEMTDYIKSQNSKIETVEYDWDSVSVGTIGNGMPQGAGKSLQLFGRFNNLSESGFRLDFDVNDEGKIIFNSMTLGQPLSLGGENYE